MHDAHGDHDGGGDGHQTDGLQSPPQGWWARCMRGAPLYLCHKQHSSKYKTLSCGNTIVPTPDSMMGCCCPAYSQHIHSTRPGQVQPTDRSQALALQYKFILDMAGVTFLLRATSVPRVAADSVIDEQIMTAVALCFVHIARCHRHPMQEKASS